MDELKQNIQKILDQFAREELGNRLSQFAMIALTTLIMTEIDKFESIKQEINKK